MLRSFKAISVNKIGSDHRNSETVIISQCAVVFILYILFYGTVLVGLVVDWYTYDLYSYGFLVPIISGYLIWRKTAELKSIPIIPTMWGSVPLFIAVILYLVGQVVADTFIMRISMVLALVALVQIMFGTHYLKALAFPLVYLFFMIPFPYLLAKNLRNALMFVDAAVAAKVVQMLGIPIYLEANYLHLPNIVLEVAEICSGVASVFALFVLGLVYGYVLRLSLVKRLLLAATAVPLAVLVNLIRLVITVVLAYHFGPFVVESHFHMLTGTFNFLLSVFLLLMLGEVLRKNSRTAAQQAQPDKAKLIDAGKTRTGWLATATATMILALGIYFSIASANSAKTPVQVHLEKLPSSFGTYAITTAEWPDRYEDLQAEQTISRIYSTREGVPLELFVGFLGTNAGGVRLQSPNLILPRRWNYLWVKSTRVEISGAEPVESNWMLTQQGGAKRLVLYWYQSRGRTFSGEFYYRIALLTNRIVNGGSDMSVIRIATPVPENEKIEAAQSRLKRFATQLYPELGKIFPAS